MKVFDSHDEKCPIITPDHLVVRFGCPPAETGSVPQIRTKSCIGVSLYYTVPVSPTHSANNFNAHI